MIIQKIAGKAGSYDLTGIDVDTVLLSGDELSRNHRRLTTLAGRELAVSLERGTLLADGDILYLDDTSAVVVRAAEEEYFVLVPETPLQCGLVGYTIGNMHMKAYFADSEVLVPYDSVLEPALRKLGVAYTRQSRIPSGVPGSGHSHG